MKNRTLNEIRQSKEYQLDENKEFFMQAVRAQSKEYQLAKDIADANNKNPNVTTSNPFEHSEVEKTVDQIVENLQPVIYDTIFELICNEMSTRYVFDSSEYLTEAGLELFEDEWFEFYHENHGKIIHKILQNLK